MNDQFHPLTLPVEVAPLCVVRVFCDNTPLAIVDI